MDVFEKERPDIVIHLEAQACVRYSIENPLAYLESYINETFELLKVARAYPLARMLLASSSSAYGANEDMPYKENVKADLQMSFYAATKKSTENMMHSYAYLFNLPITVFHFFTVYGPWGRPDMALFIFTKAILNGEPIDAYNHGDMSRDFAYIDDLVNAVSLLIDANPDAPTFYEHNADPIDSRSHVALFRVVNIGNPKPAQFLEVISAIETSIGKKALKTLFQCKPVTFQPLGQIHRF